MADTQTMTFSCENVHVSPINNQRVELELSNPDIDDLITEISEGDLIDWVKRNKNPEDLFSETELDKWAEANGYVRGGDNE